MSVNFNNVVTLLNNAAEGKDLYVLTTQNRWDGIYIEPAKDRFFADDLISDKKVHATVPDKSVINASAVHAATVMTMMELADNAVPVVRCGQILGWDLDNNKGLIRINPAKAKEALANLRIHLH